MKQDIHSAEDQRLYLQGLHYISPFDGREVLFVQGLKNILSEGALHRYRAVVEIEALISLADSNLARKPEISITEREVLRGIVAAEKFDSRAVAEYDHFGRLGIGPLEHDVKAVEMYLRERLTDEGLGRLNEFVHFPMTSEDVNNIAYNLMLREAINSVWLPKVLDVGDRLAEMAQQYADVPVLGKTHGMNASPTTIGKRFGYTLDKMVDSLTALEQIRLNAKFSGPVGNHNAMMAIAGEFDIDSYAQKFVERFGFEYAGIENQRISHQRIVRLFNEMGILNTFGADLCDNIRQNVMLGWLYQEGKKTHVGSSVMPHKINPWFFEVGQGYFEITNTLIGGMRDGLLMSAFERDLTDHPWERMYGEIIAGSVVGFSYIAEGLQTLRVNEEAARRELQTTPEVLSEAVQIAGRLLGVADVYTKIKMLTRGKKLDKEGLVQIIKEVLPDSVEREQLLKLTPEVYTGRAAAIAQESVAHYRSVRGGVRRGILHDLLRIEGVFFDFDNTLQQGDKEELHARLNAISEQMVMSYTLAEIECFGNRSDYKEMRRMMVNEFNKKGERKITEEDFDLVNKKVSGTFDDRFYLADGAEELLHYLHTQEYKIGLVTTRGSNSLPRLLERHGIRKYFQVVVNRDDCKEVKPHPQQIVTALERLGVHAHRAVYVGDKQVDDIIAGNSLGMKTILVHNGEREKYCAQPTYHVKTPREILEMFLRK